MTKLKKQDFVKKYNYSPSTYQRLMSELKNTEIFSAAYERVTGQEVWINTELYDKFLSFKSYNRLRTRKVTPKEFIEKHLVDL